MFQPPHPTTRSAGGRATLAVACGAAVLAVFAAFVAAQGRGSGAVQPAGEASMSVATGALEPGAKVALVELFTSEGCSSCPPADALLRELGQRGTIDGVAVVPLSFHVDYWDGLGWPDPWSSDAATQRQRGYAVTMKLRSTYTPQMVFNGRAEGIGSRREEALRHLAETAVPNASGGATLEVRRGDDGRPFARLDAPSSDPASEAVYYMAFTASGLKSDVKSGENAGRVLAHDNVVLDFRLVRPGQAIDFGDALARSADAAGGHRVVAWRQERFGGPVTAIWQADLPAAATKEE